MTAHKGGTNLNILQISQILLGTIIITNSITLTRTSIHKLNTKD